MAFKSLVDLAKNLEEIALTPFTNGMKRSAENIVKELQDAGPQWTGEFANSWEISSSSETARGTKNPGAPQRIKAPRLTASQFKFKPSVKYNITNTAPYRDYAMDLKEGIFKGEGNPRKPPVSTGSRPVPGRRGDVTGSGGARSTAELNWYSDYVNGGRLDKAIKLYMDEEIRRANR